MSLLIRLQRSLQGTGGSCMVHSGDSPRQAWALQASGRRLQVHTPVLMQQVSKVSASRAVTEQRLSLITAAGKASGSAEEDSDATLVPGKPVRVERLLANLGYGKRQECAGMVKVGAVVTTAGAKLKVGDKVCHGDVMLLSGEALDPPPAIVVMLHKPVGYVTTSPSDKAISDPIVYDLLPYRFAARRPFLAPVGRLDKDTSGLLLLTDDGTLLQRIISPKKGIWKVYDVTLAQPLVGKAADAAVRKFASGSLLLVGDHSPLLPARLQMTGERSARVAVCEGRYHQVRRMFTAIGNEVLTLNRSSIGALTLGELPLGEWCFLDKEQVEAVFGTSDATEAEDAAAADSASQPHGVPAAAATAAVSVSSSSSTSASTGPRGPSVSSAASTPSQGVSSSLQELQELVPRTTRTQPSSADTMRYEDKRVEDLLEAAYADEEGLGGKEARVAPVALLGQGARAGQGGRSGGVGRGEGRGRGLVRGAGSGRGGRGGAKYREDDKMRKTREALKRSMPDSLR